MSNIQARVIVRFGAMAVGLAWAGSSAHASLIISSGVNSGSLGIATGFVNFNDTGLLPSGFGGGTARVYNSTGADTNTTVGVTFANGGPNTGQAVTNASANVYAAPYFNNVNNTDKFGGNPPGGVPGANTTQYLTSGKTPGGMASVIFGGNQHYVGLLWGSVDTYNTLSLFDGNTLVGTVTGTQVLDPANGYQGPGGSAYVNITSNISFDRIVATSNDAFAFEFDNVAFAAAPEPATITLACSGLVVLGLGAARRRICKAS